MADVKISELPQGIATESAIVPATNAAGSLTEKVTLGSIAALAVDAGQLTIGTLADARLSSNVVRVTQLDTQLGTKVTNAGNVNAIQRLTQAEYDAIATPDPNTLYVIVG